MSTIHVVLDLTQREADELLRAELRPRRVGMDSSGSVAWSLESATAKLRDAIVRASRG